MRRISIAIGLTTLLLASLCSAQQSRWETSRTRLSYAPPASLTVWVPRMAASRSSRWSPTQFPICDSVIYEASPYGTGGIGILNANP